MDIPEPKRRPGDLIIDRYMTGATETEREAARENLYAYVAALLRIAARRANEEYESGIRTNSQPTVK